MFRTYELSDVVIGNNSPHQGYLNLTSPLHHINPYKENLQGCVVESTYNWYWLVDGLMEADYVVHLAHPAAIEQYNGIKYTNDYTDARFLAHLLILDILPTGYIPERITGHPRHVTAKTDVG